MTNKIERRLENQRALDQAEKDNIVADSIEYRKALMQKVDDGEITLEQAQKELKSVKRNAKKKGLITRNQAYTGRY